MANPTKKLEVHENPQAFVRVYMDLRGEVNEKLEALAKANGRTKKGQLEFLVNEAITEIDAREKETVKRAGSKKKGVR